MRRGRDPHADDAADDAGDAADERALMRRAQEGDRPAFDDLVRIYHRAIYSYARRVLRDEDLAAEVAQDTFVRAFRYRASYAPASGTVRAWLFAVAANRIRDARKGRRDEPSALDDASNLAASGEEGLEAFARGALREAVQQALGELPLELREVVALKYLSDLSYDEVGKALGLSVSAAKMRALRARDVLARRLARLMRESGEETTA